MSATDILADEHRVIEQVLACLEQLTVEALEQRALDENPAWLALDFFGTFAGRCHHGKEEHCLFPLLEAKGFPPHDGPTGVMRHEHERGREHLRGMAVEVRRAGAGDANALTRFAGHARDYIRLMREHIAKEDHRLFPMAAVVLTEEDQAKLLTAFERMDEQYMNSGTHERYLQIADELADRYGVTKVEPAEHHCHGCFHHAALH
jgi:hemerythrin-like domain-containing protein